jgi:hypothetical protein
MKAVGVFAMLVVLGSPLAVTAYECPKLQAQVDREYGKRFDRTASTVRTMAKQAAALHKAGKDAESKKMCEETAKATGMNLAEVK